jgi:ABC-type microcin C transport system permease subunit YejB
MKTSVLMEYNHIFRRSFYVFCSELQSFMCLSIYYTSSLLFTVILYVETVLKWVPHGPKVLC